MTLNLVSLAISGWVSTMMINIKMTRLHKVLKAMCWHNQILSFVNKKPITPLPVLRFHVCLYYFIVRQTIDIANSIRNKWRFEDHLIKVTLCFSATCLYLTFLDIQFSCFLWLSLSKNFNNLVMWFMPLICLT